MKFSYCILFTSLFLWLAPCSLEGTCLSLEAKGGAFFPSSKRLRNIFGTSLPFVEILGKYAISCSWNIEGGVGYIFDSRHFSKYHSKSSIKVYPFRLGISLNRVLGNKLQYLFGASVLYSLLRNTDHSPYVHKYISHNAFGALVTAGLSYKVGMCMTASASLEYMYQQFSFHKIYKKHFTYRHTVNMNGLKGGLGITYSF